MNRFTASNGIVVNERTVGGYYFGDFDLGALTGFAKDQADALQEFFRAEEDTRLGRWRWPENPDYVVYQRGADPFENARRVRVIFEPTGDSADTAEGSTIYGPFKDAARAYFDAHPEPKPAWHDAKEGELWVLTVDGEECGAMARPDRTGIFDDVVFEVAGRGPFGCVATAITDGRRIWPEVAS